MIFTLPVRKFTLLMHVISSVGWLGGVAAFFVLTVAGLNSSDLIVSRAVYVAMPPMTDWIIVPFAIISLVTGLLLAVFTPWGLIRHYWIIFKLLISSLSLPLLFLHTTIIRHVAAAAVEGPLFTADLHHDRVHLVVASAASFAALATATALSIYKPRGRTSWRG